MSDPLGGTLIKKHSGKFMLVAGVLIFCAGSAFGHSDAPTRTETVFIHTPPSIKVVHDTKTVQGLLPKECLALGDNMDATVLGAVSRVTKAAGNIQTGLDDLDLKVYQKSVPAINQKIAYVNAQSDRMTDGATDLGDASETLHAQVSACKEALKHVG